MLSLLLSSRSEMHQGAGAVVAMSVKAQQKGWCPCSAGQRASLFVPWSDVRDATPPGEQRGRWSAMRASKELLPLAPVPERPRDSRARGEGP